MIGPALGLGLAPLLLWAELEAEPPSQPPSSSSSAPSSAPSSSLATAPRRTTIFLDFGGGPLGPGADASLGQASCVGSEFLYPIFLGSERASELAVAEARRLVAPYGVRVVAEPPPRWLPYTHVRLGGAAEVVGLDPKLNGLSCQVDCDDLSERDTVFVFSDKWIKSAVMKPEEEGLAAEQLGRLAVHEVAHAWGLEHAGGTESVMARFPSVLPSSFVEGCQALDLDHDSECPQARSRYCPEGQQDADAELRALFGDGEVDTQPPRAEILWPPDGLVLRPGEVLEVEIEVQDDHAGFGWMIEVPALDWQHMGHHGAQTVSGDGRSTFASLPLVVPEGSWTLRLEAIDHDRNVGEAVVHIQARPEAEPPPQPLPPQAACACRAPDADAGTRWGWWVVVLAAARRRRARPRRALRRERP